MCLELRNSTENVYECLLITFTFLGNKELNQVADTLVYDSENKLLRTKFLFWRKLTKHSQVAKYHHETKMVRRYDITFNNHENMNDLW